MLPGIATSTRLARARPANTDKRPYTQGSKKDSCRKEGRQRPAVSGRHQPGTVDADKQVLQHLSILSVGSCSRVAKGKKRNVRRNVTVGVAHVKATFNNTTVTITDSKGDTLCWASAGTCGFKGSRKSTPFAGQCAAQQAAEKAIKFGVKEVGVRVNGPGSGRESAITALQAAGLTVKSLKIVHLFPTTVVARLRNGACSNTRIANYSFRLARTNWKQTTKP